MKRHLFRILTAFLLVMLPRISGTNAYFTDATVIDGNTFTTGCWALPTAPALVSPADNTAYTSETSWILDWNDSSTSCPTGTLTYQMQLFKGTTLVYQTGWQTATQAAVSNLDDGIYYWGVTAKTDYGATATSSVWSFTVNRTPHLNPGDVVINEVMWMGSTVHELDEWVELRNMTNRQIDLTGWKLYGAGDGVNAITLNGSIEANSFFLLTHFKPSDSAIKNSIVADQVSKSIKLTNSPGEQLTLKDSAGTIIDQTPADSWPAGSHTSPASKEQSMERNDIPGDGTLATSWHTCLDAQCNDTTYWDVEGENYGTPRAANLSGNDPTSQMAVTNLELGLTGNQASLLLSGVGLQQFTTAHYIISYIGDEVAQQLEGDFDIAENPLTHLVSLGSCSSGGICVYPQEVTQMSAEVLLDNGVIQRTLTQEYNP